VYAFQPWRPNIIVARNGQLFSTKWISLDYWEQGHIPESHHLMSNIAYAE
jgi:hypothetical protein